MLFTSCCFDVFGSRINKLILFVYRIIEIHESLEITTDKSYMKSESSLRVCKMGYNTGPQNFQDKIMAK